MSFLRRYAPVVTLVVALMSLYLYRLAGVGVMDPDEPRYLAIGRWMAASGDYVTPHLWGLRWYEKPPLLYWLTALGAKAQLGTELSGRLPVALLSLLFLAAMFVLVRAEYGEEIAAICVALLGCSAGWLVYSSLALTDLPLAVFYGLAVLLALPLVGLNARQPRSGRLFAIGMSLGMATLAKGLVPIVLAAPFLWFLRAWWRRWWIVLAGLLAIALPWYSAVTLQNGKAFLIDFFWKHHVERAYSATLQHVQPWWFYIPVLFGALVPWTPLLPFLFRRKQERDRRFQFLAVCAGWGIFFFSLVLNKLPGYLLPLLPGFVLLLAISVEWHARSVRYWLIACAVLLSSLPLAAQLLPPILAAGRLTPLNLPPAHATEIFYIALPLAVVALGRRNWLVPLLALCFVACTFYIKITTYPVLDRTASARAMWEKIRDTRGLICDDWIPRKWAYGLALYRGSEYPMCGTPGVKYDFKLQPEGAKLPALVRAKQQ